MPDWIPLVSHFTASSPWICSCQKCCRGRNENLCGWLLEEKLSSAKQKNLPFGESWVTSCLRFCWTSHLCPSISVSQPRSVASTEVLPEHHKPLGEDHLLAEGMWCCLCSKPAGPWGFPGGTRAACAHPGTNPHLCTACEHELKSACKEIMIKKKHTKKKPQNQQHGPTHRNPLENLWLL